MCTMTVCRRRQLLRAQTVTNTRRNGPLRRTAADRKATELVFVVTAAAAAENTSARRGQHESDSRLMGGSAHSTCQSQPSYPLND